MSRQIIRLSRIAAVVAAAGDEERPEVRATALPRQVTRGNLLQIQAIFLDVLLGSPVRIKNIWMKIQTDDGRIVYPPSVVARNQSGMIIDISTLEFSKGRYALMVSNDASFSPSDTAYFEVTGPDLPEPAPVFEPITKNQVKKTAVPDKDLDRKANEFVENVPLVPLLPADRSSALFQSKVRFVAVGDLKTCPICQAFDGEVYEQDDVRKPNIPADTHPNCRCVFEYVDQAPSSHKITAEEADVRATRFRNQ